MIKKSQEHLNLVNESYAEHMSVAFKIGSKMITSGFMALIHGLIPAIFEKNGSNRIKELYNFINQKR
ncbi:DUF6356 family protein [Candidatus Pelagibacter sp.]|uniref:DUF6356 family protein n=1 Tax=Candidatus Pelagibacter sp. TaxID=2024849 RepID=UPI003F871C04